jgi:hypothetical protein
MSVVGVLLGCAVCCWCGALLHLATRCLDLTAAGVELQMAGLGARLSVISWFWLRVLASLMLATFGAYSAICLLPALPWLIPSASFAGALAGWRLSRCLLWVQIHQRARALNKALPAFVDRLTVALACGNKLHSSLRLASVWSHSSVMGQLMLQLLSEVADRNHAARPAAMIASAAPSGVASVVRLIRAARLVTEPWEAERQLLRQLESWSRVRGRCAYDLPEVWQGGSINDIEMESSLFYI